MVVFHLFVSFFKIGLLTLGGGAVMLPMMEDEFVRRRGWLDDEEMVGIFTAVQALPGVIAFKASLLIGYRIAGVSGALLSLLGVSLPSILIIILLSEFIEFISHYSGAADFVFSIVRSGVCALTLVMLLRLGKKSLKRAAAYLLAIVDFLAVVIVGLNPLLVIIGAALPGWFLFSDES